MNHTSDIVRLRNQKNSLYYLNQGAAISVTQQEQWASAYHERDDDIYWCVVDKTKTIIGTIRLYDIAHNGSCCEIGSFIIDEKYAMVGAYALEAKLLAITFAFEKLQIERVLNKNRSDNKNMNSISKRLGSVLLKEFDLRGVPYKLFELRKEKFQKDSLTRILNLWTKRELE